MDCTPHVPMPITSSPIVPINHVCALVTRGSAMVIEPPLAAIFSARRSSCSWLIEGGLVVVITGALWACHSCLILRRIGRGGNVANFWREVLRELLQELCGALCLGHVRKRRSPRESDDFCYFLRRHVRSFTMVSSSISATARTRPRDATLIGWRLSSSANASSAPRSVIRSAAFCS